MSDSKGKKDKPLSKTEEIGRKIWLAGLGAYGQSYDNMQSSVEKINSETRNFFEKLVARGEELENATKRTITETRDNAVKATNSHIKAQGDRLASSAEKIQNLSIDDLKLDKLKPESLSLDHISDNINHRLDDIRDRVSQLVPGMVTRQDIEKLTSKIDSLAASAAKVAKPTRSRKSPASAANKSAPEQTDGDKDA